MDGTGTVKSRATEPDVTVDDSVLSARDARITKHPSDSYDYGTDEKAENRLGRPASTPAGLQKQHEQFVPMRARFIVDEIAHTTRGVTVLTMRIEHDGHIKPEETLVPGNDPQGQLKIECNPEWCAKNVAHGTVFYLQSTNPLQNH